MMKSARISAVLFVLWGLLHVVGGTLIMARAAGDPDSGYAFYSPPAAGYPALAGDVLAYLAYSFAWAGLLVTWIGVRYNWCNTPRALALNTCLVGCTDLGLVAFLVLPGHLALADASPGLLLFAGAAFFGALARRGSHEAATSSAGLASHGE
jgi:hypothetical protein